MKNFTTIYPYTAAQTTEKTLLYQQFTNLPSGKIQQSGSYHALLFYSFRSSVLPLNCRTNFVRTAVHPVHSSAPDSETTEHPVHSSALNSETTEHPVHSPALNSEMVVHPVLSSAPDSETVVHAMLCSFQDAGTTEHPMLSSAPDSETIVHAMLCSFLDAETTEHPVLSSALDSETVVHPMHFDAPLPRDKSHACSAHFRTPGRQYTPCTLMRSYRATNFTRVLLISGRRNESSRVRRSFSFRETGMPPSYLQEIFTI